ncbi:hypothetical protein U1Q18_002482 [Sarracenia purpurea var. burkii]
MLDLTESMLTTSTDVSGAILQRRARVITVVDSEPSCQDLAMEKGSKLRIRKGVLDLTEWVLKVNLDVPEAILVRKLGFITAVDYPNNDFKEVSEYQNSERIYQ